jgi:hypothetical protein
MIDTLKNLHRNTKKSLLKHKAAYGAKVGKKIGPMPCVAFDTKCKDRKKQEKLDLIKKNNSDIIKEQNSLKTPPTFKKAFQQHYNTGIINTSTGSKCNMNMNGHSFISKYSYGMATTNNLITKGYASSPDISGHNVVCKNSCNEAFENNTNNTNNTTNTTNEIYTTNNYSDYFKCNRNIGNILLLVLFSICLIIYLYFFIKDLINKVKKKY